MWSCKQMDEEELRFCKRDARDYALLHGLVLRNPQLHSDNCVEHLPFTLFPTPFPKKLYQECLDIQPIINNLMLKIANDNDFMEDNLNRILAVDEFTRKLFSIHQVVQRQGLAQPIMSCISRSDYLLDKYLDNNHASTRLRQVEVNAIASGMSAHSHNVSQMHKYLMNKYVLYPRDLSIPLNESIELIATGMIDAYDAYNKSDCYILLVAEDISKNFSDHLHIELTIAKLRPDIKLIRRKLNKLHEIIRLGPNKELFVVNDKEIALVYFRYGYDPSNYVSSHAWETRLLMEGSRAIKCPSISFHLSGAKKFQQVLNSQEQLEKFLDHNEAERLSKVFCKFWSLESDSCDGEAGFQLASKSPDNLVLKPQREGGGHNIFGADIKQYLSSIKPADRSQYILMEYINSPKEKNLLLLHDDDDDKFQLGHHQLISELGIYGSILAEGNVVRNNRSSGYLVRSKKFGVKEGGVSSGYAGISSLMLFEDDTLDKLTYYDV